MIEGIHEAGRQRIMSLRTLAEFEARHEYSLRIRFDLRTQARDLL